MDQKMSERVDLLEQWIKESDNVVFFGGAGVSTESGIPDFRSVDGLYNQQYDYPPETIISHSFYRKNPEEFYRFYKNKMLFPDAQPNASDDGAVLGTAFRADDTITFSFGKKGQYLWPGNEYCGKVHVVSMGITQESWLDHKPHTAVLEPEDLKKLPSRMAHTNKGSYGKLLIIAGSVNMSGAACFCAKAAYRMGSGLVINLSNH